MAAEQGSLLGLLVLGGAQPLCTVRLSVVGCWAVSGSAPTRHVDSVALWRLYTAENSADPQQHMREAECPALR